MHAHVRLHKVVNNNNNNQLNFIGRLGTDYANMSNHCNDMEVSRVARRTDSIVYSRGCLPNFTIENGRFD